MKKKGIVLFSISLVLAISVVLPQLGSSNPMVDETGCVECHDASLGSGLHAVSAHADCTACHDGTPSKGNVSSASCLDCHPAANSELCDLVSFHEDSMDYDPSGASCLTCHPACEGGNGDTTTTTTIPQSVITDSRYEVFLVGSVQIGCSATTLTFREDNVLILECIEGFGTYLSFGNLFSGFYWSNNFFQGSGMLLFLSGVAIDPYIVGGGIAYTGYSVSPVVVTGYRLDIL